MATPETLRRLLLKYFKNAPRAEVEACLEIMYIALSEAQKQALKAKAKSFLLPKVEMELVVASGTFNFLRSETDEALAGLDENCSDAETLVDDVNSL